VLDLLSWGLRSQRHAEELSEGENESLLIQLASRTPQKTNKSILLLICSKVT
jgi:hypothetical protein